MEKDKRGPIAVMVLLAVLALIFAGEFVARDHSLKARIYEYRMQDTYVAAFYCYSFDMKAVADPPVYENVPVPGWGFWPTVFHRIEYVMELPPEGERKWAVIYIGPGPIMTQSQIDTLNQIIDGDPGIEIDKRLTLPLTVEQILAYPDAVLEIIKQLDREQWESFYPGEKITRPTAEKLARQAGIEVPT